MIGTMTAVGFQVVCIRSLSKGDRETAGIFLGVSISSIIAEADEVNYTTMFNLNNLLIRIRDNKENEK